MLLSQPGTSSLSPPHRYPASFASHLYVPILISYIFIPPLQSPFLLWKMIACTFSSLAKHGPELGISYLLGSCLTQPTILLTFIETWKMSISFLSTVRSQLAKRKRVCWVTILEISVHNQLDRSPWLRAVAHRMGVSDGAKRGGAEVSQAVQRHTPVSKDSTLGIVSFIHTHTHMHVRAHTRTHTHIILKSIFFSFSEIIISYYHFSLPFPPSSKLPPMFLFFID